MELPDSSLYKHCYHAAPVFVLESLGVVGDIELDCLSSKGVLEVNPLLEADVSHRLLVLPIDKKLPDVSQAKIARVKMLRDNQNGVFLFRQKSVDSHLAISSIFSILNGLGDHEQVE